MVEVKVRNLLTAAGAYYLSWWIEPFFAFGWGKLTNRIHYLGDFEGAVVMPLVTHFPEAVFAAGVGAAVVWLVESNAPIRWALIPAALYAFFDYRGYHWAITPTLADRTSQVVGALFLFLACLIGATVMFGHRAAWLRRDGTR